MSDNDITGLDVEGREALAESIRAQQVKTDEAMTHVDKQYEELVRWWREARPVFADMAHQNSIEFGRADCVAIMMATLGTNHNAADLAMMLATKIVDEVGV